jgi:8-oxo-dGTP pyrophosphatase MutT (NUDIX family)
MSGEQFFAGGFLYNQKSQSVLLHKRDGNTTVNPHKWGFFGGLSEGEETPIETFMREMKEELDIDLVPDEIMPLCDYLNEERNVWRYVFLVKSDWDKSTMRLGEGADFDWIPLSRVFGFDLTDKTADDLRFFVKIQRR